MLRAAVAFMIGHRKHTCQSPLFGLQLQNYSDCRDEKAGRTARALSPACETCVSGSGTDISYFLQSSKDLFGEKFLERLN
jgi:hypothetical protein